MQNIISASFFLEELVWEHDRSASWLIDTKRLNTHALPRLGEHVAGWSRRTIEIAEAAHRFEEKHSAFPLMRQLPQQQHDIRHVGLVGGHGQNEEIGETKVRFVNALNGDLPVGQNFS